MRGDWIFDKEPPDQVELGENTMRSKAYLKIIITLIATLGVSGLVETVGAKPDPDKPKGPRGLEGRTFVADVYSTATGPENPLSVTCITFNADGTWHDAYFQVAGRWIQDSKGPKGPKGPTKGTRTSYTIADATTGPDITSFEQSGRVTPAGGYLQLWAESTVIFAVGLPPAEFVSIGHEDSDCVETHFST